MSQRIQASIVLTNSGSPATPRALPEPVDPATPTLTHLVRNCQVSRPQKESHPMNTIRTNHPNIFWIAAMPLGLLAAFIALMVVVAVAQHPATGILIILLLAAYWAPTTVAAIRHHQVGTVAVLNGLLAWTVLGWIIALAIACGDRHRDTAR